MLFLCPCITTCRVYSFSRCRLDDIFSFLPYNKKLRLTRKFMHTTLGTERLAGRYLEIQEKEAHRLLFRVLQKPDLLFDHLKKYVNNGTLLHNATYANIVQRGRRYYSQDHLRIYSRPSQARPGGSTCRRSYVPFFGCFCRRRLAC